MLCITLVALISNFLEHFLIDFRESEIRHWAPFIQLSRWPLDGAKSPLRTRNSFFSSPSLMPYLFEKLPLAELTKRRRF